MNQNKEGMPPLTTVQLYANVPILDYTEDIVNTNPLNKSVTNANLRKAQDKDGIYKEHKRTAKMMGKVNSESAHNIGRSEKTKAKLRLDRIQTEKGRGFDEVGNKAVTRYAGKRGESIKPGMHKQYQRAYKMYLGDDDIGKTKKYKDGNDHFNALEKKAVKKVKYKNEDYVHGKVGKDEDFLVPIIVDGDIKFIKDSDIDTNIPRYLRENSPKGSYGKARKKANKIGHSSERGSTKDGITDTPGEKARNTAHEINYRTQKKLMKDNPRMTERLHLGRSEGSVRGKKRWYPKLPYYDVSDFLIPIKTTKGIVFVDQDNIV